MRMGRPVRSDQESWMAFLRIVVRQHVLYLAHRQARDKAGPVAIMGVAGFASGIAYIGFTGAQSGYPKPLVWIGVALLTIVAPALLGWLKNRARHKLDRLKRILDECDIAFTSDRPGGPLVFHPVDKIPEGCEALPPGPINWDDYDHYFG